jgi:general secretion pathway protein J
LARADHRRRGGFTLVELLVSMVVLSFVALIMMGGLRFVVRAFSHTDSRRAALEELTASFAVLRQELERAEPLMVKVGNDERVLFEGTPDRVRFVNVEPPYLGGLPYRVYEYAVVGDGGDYRIELRRAPFDPAEPDLAVVEDTDPRVLLRVPRPLTFTYFGQEKRDERAGWHDEWARHPQLPTAVRLAEGEDPGWPDLLVPLLIRAPWYCGSTERPPNSAGCEPPR